MKNLRAKKGFTLIEMIIAVIIFSLVVILLYNIIGLLKKTKDKDIASYQKYHKMQELKRLFYQDLMYATDIKIDNAKKRVLFKTTNSLYGYSNPYVEYILAKNRLFRVESYKKLSLYLKSSMLDSSKILLLLKSCKEFSIFKEKRGIILYLKASKENIFKIYFTKQIR